MAAGAALLGGLAWAAKAGAILAAGGFRWEGEAVALGAGLVGLSLAAAAPSIPRSRLRAAALASGATAAVLSAANLAYEVAAPDAPGAPFPFNASYALATLGLLAGLVLAGLAGRGVPSRPAWTRIALALGVLFVPLLVVGGALEALVASRLLEVPVLLLGGGLVAMGVALLRDAV